VDLVSLSLRAAPPPEAQAAVFNNLDQGCLVSFWVKFSQPSPFQPQLCAAVQHRSIPVSWHLSAEARCPPRVPAPPARVASGASTIKCAVPSSDRRSIASVLSCLGQADGKHFSEVRRMNCRVPLVCSVMNQRRMSRPLYPAHGSTTMPDVPYLMTITPRKIGLLLSTGSRSGNARLRCGRAYPHQWWPLRR